MGRNLYILAATLLLFSLVSCGLAYTNVAQQPGSPGDQSLWRTTGLGLLVLSIVIAIVGMMSALFEQAERRAEEARLRERAERRRRGQPEEPERPRATPPVRLSLGQLARLRKQIRDRDADSGDER